MKSNPAAVSFAGMMAQELPDISNRRQRRQNDPIAAAGEWQDQADAARFLGVCMSGGGIRSGTFGLGVLQGLNEKNLLRRVDYLSTVSGGGYIGSWLHGVLHRSHSLADVGPADVESSSLKFLRKYSNYLAPRPGLSLDSAVIAVIWLRNMMLNQAIVIAAAFALILACLAPGWLLHREVHESHLWVLYTLLLVAFLAMLVVVLEMASNLKTATRRDTDSAAVERGSDAGKIGWYVMVPLVLGVLLFIIVIPGFARLTPPHLVETTAGQVHRMAIVVHGMPGLRRVQISVMRALSDVQGFWAGLGFCCLFILHALLQGYGGFRKCYKLSHTGWRQWLWLPHLIWMSAASAAVTFGLLAAVAYLIRLWDPAITLGAYRAISWGPPLTLLAVMFSVGLQVGLMGKDFPDSGREWVARVGAWIATFAIGWTAVSAVAVFVPLWIAELARWKGPAAWSALVGWAGSTAASVLAGKSSKAGDASAEKEQQSVSLDLIARYGPLVAIPGFFMLIAVAVHAVLETLHATPGPEAVGSSALIYDYWHKLESANMPLVLLLFFASVAVFLILSSRVNINEFSMHHFYRNRLVRCYLGASNDGRRRANRFTGFDPQDDFNLDLMRCESPNGNLLGPYPILNATLTVTQGAELATQERKAKSWTFTPRYSGFEPSPAPADDDQQIDIAANGLVPTETVLGGNMHLGTAMAISGAALNPNQGYHSAPQVAFLMTLFDVRLGWWIGNPRADVYYRRPGPRVALGPLLRELFGWADERSPYLNLSDGGNFENLGLYQLVKRRAKYIIAIDGEEDGDYEFQALASGVRKCRADLGVEINISPHVIRPLKDGVSPAHCVVGRIYYPDNVMGWLFYIKSSVTGDEPADVEEYRRRFPEFPQQSTLNQFFTESQFESYRRLGLHVVRSAIDFMPGVNDNLEHLFQRLSDRWEAPPEAPEGGFSHQTEAYSDLLKEWMDTPGLGASDETIVDRKPAFVTTAQRERYFMILKMIQLMENVFVEYDFAQVHNREHPAYDGWIKVFRYWTGRAEVQQIWETQKQNYGRSFRQFLDDLIARQQPLRPQQQT